MKFTDVNEYLAAQAPESLEHLMQIRKLLQETLTEAEEVISYNMPAFKQGKMLVYYAASKKHLGFYPTPNPIKVFQDRLQDYKFSAGAIQFPYNQPLPTELIREITLFRLQEVVGD